MTGTLLVFVLGQHKVKPMEFPPARPALFLPTPGGPRLAKVSGQCVVRPSSTDATVSMPVPLDYTGQKVVGFRIQAEPAGNLSSWRWRNDGVNRYVEVHLAGSTETTLSWDATVIAPIETVVRTQDKDFDQWRAWSPLVAKSPRVAKQAKAFRNDEEPHESVARWTASRMVKSSKGSTSGEAWTRGGDALGRACLAAALLRSNKVGARIVQYVSSVNAFPGFGWMTEAQTQSGRWQEVDPYIGLTDPERNSWVAMNVVSVADEVKPVPHKSVPWASAGSVDRYDLTVKPLAGFPAPAAGRLLSSAYVRADKVADSAAKGVPVWDDEETLMKTVKAGLLPLCRLLDGQS